MTSSSILGLNIYIINPHSSLPSYKVIPSVKIKGAMGASEKVFSF